MLESMWRWIAARLVFVRGTTYRFWANRAHDVREYQHAVDAFSRAAEMDPNFVEAYYSRGILYWRELRNPYRAIRDLTRVMDMLPERAEAWFNRAQAHTLRGDYHLAIADLEHYLSIGHDSGWRINAETQLALLRDLDAEKQARAPLGNGGRH
ncbi:MAG: tetratricopeptide repeat protein [Thermoflexales bacterium]|nr:tetratricopeptide repeat protein [Thermoflexales bacterium]